MSQYPWGNEELLIRHFGLTEIHIAVKLFEDGN